MKLLSVLFFILLYNNTIAQQAPTWTEKELMEPSDLAHVINSNEKLPVIISVGPGAVIPNSIEVGMAREKANLDALKEKLKHYSRKTKVVIYCGCCPFEKCPNVRPALAVLREMKFTNYYLLNLPHNLKQDWIDKGYPVKN
jgi:thiosulfate/3-mercaptopyruvate sulfurtransferase